MRLFEVAMPLREVAQFSIPYLQVLDENGAVDEALDPGLPADELLRLYRAMLLAREADQRMLKLQRQGRLGTFPLCTGQEAVACGAALAMRTEDWMFGSYRELGARLMRGEPLEQNLLYYNGWEEGNTLPRQARTMPTSVILASQLPHAVGIGWAMRRLGENQTAVVTFFGDGATSQGDFHEALNFAGVWRAPVVFICQNNQWAISVPRSSQTASQTIAQKAIAYGVPGLQIDGNDPLAVYRATGEALDRARAGEGPTLIEALTYRLLMHTTADDPTRYRGEEEVKEAWRREPVARFRRYLEGRGLLDEAGHQKLEAELRAEIERAVQAAEQRPKDFRPDLLFDHVFGTRHAALEAQRAELLRDLGESAAAEALKSLRAPEASAELQAGAGLQAGSSALGSGAPAPAGAGQSHPRGNGRGGNGHARRQVEETAARARGDGPQRPAPAPAGSPRLTMVQAINLALREEMQRDGRVVLLGEDIGRDGGVFRVTDGLLEAFGPERVVDTPLAESAILGTAIGMSLAGLRPIPEMQFSGFSYLMFPQLEGNASRFRQRTLGVWSVPLVVRMPYGGAVRALEHHSESREATYGHLPGVKVVIPSGPRNARALLTAAIRDPDPVVFMEPKRSYRAFREEVPEAEETLEIGRAQLVQEGRDLTLVSWGAMMRPSLQAVAEVQERRGVRIEVIDLLTISPMDAESVVESVKQTGRCVVVQEAPRSLSVSAELIARINDQALLYLEAPVRRVTSYDVVTPYFGRELLYLPDERRIGRAIEETLDF